MTDGEPDARRSRPNRWRGPAGFAVLLVVASVLPVPSGVPAGGETDTIPLAVGFTDPFHLVGYAVFAALMTRVTGRTRRGLLLAVVTAVAFGFGVELLQAPIPWRSFAWRDAGINAVGALTGATAVVAHWRRRARVSG